MRVDMTGEVVQVHLGGFVELIAIVPDTAALLLNIVELAAFIALLSQVVGQDMIPQTLSLEEESSALVRPTSGWSSPLASPIWCSV